MTNSVTGRQRASNSAAGTSRRPASAVPEARPPWLRGGQGRTADEIEDAGTTVLILVIVAAVVVAVYVACWLEGA